MAAAPATATATAPAAAAPTAPAAPSAPAAPYPRQSPATAPAAAAAAAPAAAPAPGAEAAKAGEARTVSLLFGSQAATFGWRDGIAPADFGAQLRTAVRHVSGTETLAGSKLLWEQPEGPAREVAPRDLFQGVLRPGPAGEPPRLRVVLPEGAAGVEAAPAVGAAAAPAPAPPVSAAPGAEAAGVVGGRQRRDYTRRKPPEGKFAKAGGSQIQFMQMMGANKSPVAPLKPGTRLTVEEVAKHATASDCWTIFQGKVYDVTLYMDFHAGGKKELLRGAGKDMTAMFNKIHPWVSAEGLIGRLCLGSLVVAPKLAPTDEDEEPPCPLDLPGAPDLGGRPEAPAAEPVVPL